VKFYHGTSVDRWEKIKKSGFLWGYRVHNGKKTLSYRYTYLTPHLEVARKYGDIVLEVEYEPTGKYGIDNYGFNPPPGEEVWQFSVFVKIPICFVKVIVNNKEELKAQEEKQSD